MSKRLLPLIPAGLAVVQVLPAPDHVTILTAPQPATAVCPGCGSPSHRVHSRYGRALDDLPWQGRAVTWRVQVRRFRCGNCPGRTFAERVPDAAPGDWRNYVRGMVALLVEREIAPQGMELVIAGDVPQGAGLSSSASLEVAVGLAVTALAGAELDLTQLALIARNCGRRWFSFRK